MLSRSSMISLEVTEVHVRTHNNEMMPAIWFAVALSLTILTQTTSAQDVSPTVEEGGSLLVRQMDNIFGNDVIPRSAYLPSGADKAWLDFEHTLEPGLLTTYFFYIHNLTSCISSQVMPQIWRPTTNDNIYQLVWQQNISIDLNHTRGALCTLHLGEGDRFEIMTGDRIGIASLSNPGPISFDYVEGHITYFSNYIKYPRFVVGHTYGFDHIHLPSRFSIAVEIVPYSLAFEEGGSLFVGQLDNIFGNDVILRSAYLPNFANKAWLDFEHILEPGLLTKYYFYIHNLTSGISSQVMPQIWRPTTNDNIYQLVWQHNISIELNHTRGALCTLHLDEGDRFEIQTGDRIGIAPLSNPGPISFDYVEGHITYFSKYIEYPRFVVGHTYEFNDLHLPSRFSIAVEIVPYGRVPALSTTTLTIPGPEERTDGAEPTTIESWSFHTTAISTAIHGDNSDTVATTTEAQSFNLTTISTAVPATNSDRGLMIGISVLAGIVILMLIFGIIYVLKRKEKRQPEEDIGLEMTQTHDGYTILHRPNAPNDTVNVSTVSDRGPYDSMHNTAYSDPVYNEIMQTNEVQGRDYLAHGQPFPNVLSNETSGDNADPNSVYDEIAISGEDHSNMEQARSQTIPKTLPGETNIANNNTVYNTIDLVNTDQYHDAQTIPKTLPGETNIGNYDPVYNEIDLVKADQHHDEQTLPKVL